LISALPRRLSALSGGGLYALKPAFTRRLRRAEDLLVARHVSADAVTAAGAGCAALAGGALAAGAVLHLPLLWLAVPPLLLARLACNALDGAVARRTGTARPLGTLLNELGDRGADAAVIIGAGFAGGFTLALAAVAASFLSSLVGVMSLALTGERDSGGPAGKSERAVQLSLASTLGAVGGSTLPLHVSLGLVLAGALLTVGARSLRLRRRLVALEAR
jgi:CDP-diacylglycerol--glycerol-3-phosphate 3-phosphatidyltransferase